MNAKRYCKFCDRELPSRPEGQRGREQQYCRLPRRCKQKARLRRTRVALQMLRGHQRKTA